MRKFYSAILAIIFIFGSFGNVAEAQTTAKKDAICSCPATTVEKTKTGGTVAKGKTTPKHKRNHRGNSAATSRRLSARERAVAARERAMKIAQNALAIEQGKLKDAQKQLETDQKNLADAKKAQEKALSDREAAVKLREDAATKSDQTLKSREAAVAATESLYNRYFWIGVGSLLATLLVLALIGYLIGSALGGARARREYELVESADPAAEPVYRQKTVVEKEGFLARRKREAEERAEANNFIPKENGVVRETVEQTNQTTQFVDESELKNVEDESINIRRRTVEAEA